MTVLVGRRESFNAAHQLCNPDLSDDENRRLFGKCANLHGHNYILEVVVTGKIDQATGYILDLKTLSDLIARRIICDVDHRNLNTDVPWLKGRIPTAENLAQAFWERLGPEPQAWSPTSAQFLSVSHTRTDRNSPPGSSGWSRSQKARARFSAVGMRPESQGTSVFRLR